MSRAAVALAARLEPPRPLHYSRWVTKVASDETSAPDIAIEAFIERVVADGCGAHPTLRVTREQLAAHVSELPVPDKGWAAVAERAHTADLYLAVALRHGDPEALALLSRELTPRMAAALQKRGLGTDDTLQDVLEKLLVGDQRRIAQYSGLGTLASWLVTIAVRTALNAKRRHHRETPCTPEELFDRIEMGMDPELGALRSRYRAAMKAAFQSAWADLTSKQRTVLRYQHVNGMNIDAIGAVYGVHRATVARWRDATRAALLAGTRKHLGAAHAMDTNEINSVLALIETGLDVSLSRILREESATS